MISLLGLLGFRLFVLPDLEEKVETVRERLEKLEKNTNKAFQQNSSVKNTPILNDDPLVEIENQKESISKYISKLMIETTLLEKRLQELKEERQTFRGYDENKKIKDLEKSIYECQEELRKKNMVIAHLKTFLA